MKNNTDIRLTLQRRTGNPPRLTRPKAGQDEPRHSPQGDGGPALAQHAAQRRLYTDFLALAFYPGMHPTGPRPERATAA